MKNKKRDKAIFILIVIVLMVTGLSFLTWGDVDRYDGKLSRDEIIGIILFCLGIGSWVGTALLYHIFRIEK